MKQPNTLTRREFLKASAGVAVGGALASLPIELFAHAQGSDKLRVGLIGCGGRGTGAAIDIIVAHPSVELYALGDAFKDRLEGSLNALREELKDERKAQLNVGDRQFVGLDAYKQVIASGVDVVLLCTPPAFRPVHFREAIQAGKHVFMEKPVAVCPAGARLMFQMGELATQKGLSVVAGTQRRHEPNYIETIQRIQNGAIGEIVGGACYWNQGGLWHVEKRPEWSDVEWQMRNWLYFTWLSGDFIVEQHIHNIDVINWVLGAHPVRAMGMGGRQSRTEPHYGHIYDHFAVEFEYPNGVKVLSMCRQVDNCAVLIGERVYGSKGTADPSGSITVGGETWRYDGPKRIGDRNCTIDDVKRTIVDRNCTIGDGNCTIGDGNCTIGDGNCTIDDRRWRSILAGEETLRPNKPIGGIPYGKSRSPAAQRRRVSGVDGTPSSRR
jgi:predicted dehydrogenase